MKTFLTIATLGAVVLGAQAGLLRKLTDDDDEVVLKAKFDYDQLEAKVKVEQDESDREKGKATWTVKVEHFDEDLCPGGQLNWHIHEFGGEGITGDDCGGGVTGGHYDPTFACGGASQNQGNGICDSIDAALELAGNDPRSYECSTDEQYNCEIGDQSGKLGKIDATCADKQKFKDYWINDLASIEGRSIVLHCCSDEGCSPRIACATLNLD